MTQVASGIFKCSIDHGADAIDGVTAVCNITMGPTCKRYRYLRRIISSLAHAGHNSNRCGGETAVTVGSTMRQGVVGIGVY
jgi:hypothetical protein